MNILKDMNYELKGLLTGWKILATEYDLKDSVYPYIRVSISGPAPSIVNGQPTTLNTAILISKEEFERDQTTHVQRVIDLFMHHEAREVLFKDGKQVNEPHKDDSRI